jgi:hypothetical protein|tara:strand:- start:74 stop:751 length:678 start_codon:yes stop_codon:yes gene_type:complete
VKFDNIIIGGCSWCEHPYDYEGGERYRKTDAKPYNVKDAINYSFGKLLSDKFNVDCKNLAAAGNSNDRAFYRIWEYVSHRDLKNSLVIIGLTEITRFFVHFDNDRWVLKPSAKNRYIDMFKFLKDDMESFYKVKVGLSDDNMICEEIIMMCDLLEKYLESRGSKLLVFNSFTKNINYEPRDYFYDGFKTWAEYIESYDDEYKFNKHPNSYDHKILANNLYEYLNG